MGKFNKSAKKNSFKAAGIAVGAVTAAAAAAAGILSIRKKNKSKSDYALWEDTAKIYELKFKLNSRCYDEIIRMIKEELTPEMRVLEIAASTGDIAREIADGCGPIIASDFSETMINKAREKGTPVNLMWDIQDAECLTYPDESFDAVIIVNALNIMEDPQTVIEQAKRVLKPEGVLIVPNYVEMGGKREKLTSGLRSFFGYKNYTTWTYESYITFLAENGLTAVRQDLITGANPVAFVVAMRDDEAEKYVVDTDIEVIEEDEPEIEYATEDDGTWIDEKDLVNDEK